MPSPPRLRRLVTVDADTFFGHCKIPDDRGAIAVSGGRADTIPHVDVAVTPSHKGEPVRSHLPKFWPGQKDEVDDLQEATQW